MDITVPFYLVSFLIMAVDLVIAKKSYGQKNKRGRLLGQTCIGAFAVSISYVISTFPMEKFWVSFFSSIYFACIDLTLWYLLNFVVEFTGEKTSKLRRMEYRLFHTYMVFDCVVLMINPFWEIALHYDFRPTPFAQYTYDMLLLYDLHLLFSYLLVVSVLVHLILKAFKAPASYKNPYVLSTVGMLVIISCNAVYLYWPKNTLVSFLDYSIWLYSLAEVVFYWSCFVYPKRGMLNPLRNKMMESISQGIVLFDYEDKLLMCTERAKKMLPGVPMEEGVSMRRFMKSCGISIDPANYDKTLLFQCFPQNEGESTALQCDYRPMLNERAALMGRLFVFTDVVSATDPLTGFHNWENFRSAWGERKEYPMAVAVCDINGLQSINSRFSHAEGDQAIKNLAEAMKLHFPQNTYFVRGMDACLIALCHYTEEKAALEYLKNVQTAPGLVNSVGDPIHVQAAVSMVDQWQPDVMQAISNAEMSMKAKKLLDRNSSHSALMTSLIRALQECDNDTEAHVKRTQSMGEILGRRLELSDAQLSDLSLLCVLHDIGKIGIPLEILNKPGRLTSDEWTVLKTHVHKGYEIASSSNELRHIADMILHHHERWDGKGYPDGLSKESIPLLSRIISVVDAYDAMINDRAYRAALSKEEACAELRRCAGTQFDPGIVAELLQLLKTEEIVSPDRQEKEKDQAVHPESRPLQQPSQNRVHPVRYSRYVLDEFNCIISVDDEFVRMTGYTREDVAERKLSQRDLILPEDRTEYLCLVNEQLADGDVAYFEHRLFRKDGSVIYVFCYGKRYYDSARRAGQTEIIITDSAGSYSVGLMLNEERNKALSRLQYWEDKYRCDSLTGLLTHESFRSDVEEKLLRDDKRVMLLMMDVDRFKEYNDTFGHRAGDEFLILVSQTITGGLRKDDLACRMGGDEFAAALFFEKSVPETVMHERAQQLCDKINIVLSNEEGGTSLSMGVAISRSTLYTFNKLYEAADRTLYEAKRRGRSRMAIDNEDQKTLV